MDNKLINIIDRLISERCLDLSEYEYLVENRCEKTAEILRNEAVRLRKEIYGNKVYIRGLIEIGNICKNDCCYCGIRRSNNKCERYRLTKEEILSCCEDGYKTGFRTFVLQGGEDPYFTDEFMCGLVGEIKNRHPDCAVTLSLGERSRESYQRLFDAGADRYLLRHETADEEHYSRLHPKALCLSERLICLKNLKEIGYQVGCGFMVGSPYQSALTIAKDLKFIEQFKPDMCGIGPFIPHKDTPFRNEKAGTVELTCYLLSIIRIIKPDILLPSTTALGTISTNGREKGILASANVVMPNLSPVDVRNKYELYNNKLNTGAESAEKLTRLKKLISDIGYEIVCDRGDAVRLYK